MPVQDSDELIKAVCRHTYCIWSELLYSIGTMDPMHLGCGGSNVCALNR